MSHSLFDIKGRTTIVTGGGGGIGAVYCHEFARAGAAVVVADIDAAAAAGTAQAINDAGGIARAVAVDIAEQDSTQAMAAFALTHFGRIDALVNNAALMSQLPRGPWSAIEVADWDRVMAVNLRGLYLCCQAVFPAMRTQGKGTIVNISSNRVFDGTPNRLHYTTSKAGVIGFTRALSREVGVAGIRVNAIAPGFTESDHQVASTAPEYRAQMEALNRRKALPRTQVAHDLVGAALFLVSDASEFISGQTINVDGGFVMH